MVSDVGSLKTNSIDVNDLSSINIANIQGMKISGKDKLMKTGQEFEAVFISQLLNTVESTVERTGFMSGGPVEKKFRSMMNQYIAQDIAKNPTANFGIAKQIYEQMKNRV